MSKGKYILVNGSFVPTDEYQISLAESESIHFSEKFRAIRTSFPFFNETLEVIKLKLSLYNRSFAEFTDNNGAALKRQLERTLTKNKHFLGAVLTLTFKFTGQNITFTVQSEKVEPAGYELNEKGLYVEIFDQIRKSTSTLSNLSLGSEIYWNIAASYLKESPVDEFILVNSSDQIIETPESNIYLIKGKSVRGASSEQGAYRDITKSLMLDIFSRLNLEYTDDKGIKNVDFRDTEEIIVVNSIKGIRWIVGFEEKRYFNNTIRKISELFNQRVIS
ncbi:MAG: aminotransferase class IV [Sulfuricurvum sp.]|nr:aminotransferase class IV [Sulfuricurvum sp.]